MRKKSEKWYKSLWTRSEGISSQSPEFYSRRFCDNLVNMIFSWFFAKILKKNKTQAASNIKIIVDINSYIKKWDGSGRVVLTRQDPVFGTFLSNKSQYCVLGLSAILTGVCIFACVQTIRKFHKYKFEILPLAINSLTCLVVLVISFLN